MEQSCIVSEMAGAFVPWACPYNWHPVATINGKPPTIGRYSKDGAFFLYADGHVAFVSNDGFVALRDSLSGPDLAGFGQTPANIICPMEFPCPKTAVQRSFVSLPGEHRNTVGLSNYRNEFVELETDRLGSGKGPSIEAAHDLDVPILASHLQLQKLTLSGDFTDTSLPVLQKLKELRELRLDSDFMTEAGLSFLDQLPQLKLLTVRGKLVTNEVRQRLERRLPNCEVK